MVVSSVTDDCSFGFETFWSSIGGFTGIFLGFSLLQIPDLIVNFISKANKPKIKKRSSKLRKQVQLDIDASIAADIGPTAPRNGVGLVLRNNR